jgi:hypothetical protein
MQIEFTITQVNPNNQAHVRLVNEICHEKKNETG